MTNVYSPAWLSHLGLTDFPWFGTDLGHWQLEKQNNWLVVSQNLSKQNLHLKEKKVGKMQFITDTFQIHKIQHNI
jgi:hypothetical protein